MTDAGHEYLHPGYKKPYPVEIVLRDLAAQEGCDGEPYDAMVFAAATITTLRAQLAEARAERDAMIHPDHVEGLIKLAEPMLYEALAAETARADRAEQRVATLEAALAAQIEADAGIAGCYDLSIMSSTEADARAQAIARHIRNQPHDRTALDRMLTEAKAEALQGPWSDEPDALTDAVHKAHPVFTKKYDTYTHALELVSNRHSKGALVALVNYLLRQSDEAREKALREAADACDWGDIYGDNAVRTILALIDKEKSNDLP